jgi:hypothetical protein
MKPIYVISTITLKYGKLAEFSATMEKIRPFFEARGWKLLAAYATVVGDFNEVVDVWELADANTIGDALVSVSQDPDFLEVFPELADQVEREVLKVAIKAPFSP